MLATRETILNFIPQRHPLVMVQDIIEAGQDHCITQLKIEADNIFVEGGYLSEAGLIENIAQTAAAHVGHQCSVRQLPVPIGYIAAVKNLKIFSLPRIEEKVTTKVTIKSKVLDVTLADGIVDVEGTVCCSCEMRIFVRS
jgi:3-hydroxyacyl-[acyl-carrier-protein] dehydratase